ncbi:Pathogenicity cluster 5 protein d [Cadophora sp. M221]|nr:Pathogenicity cluster 5 protein d [Cadophora sp. M221]
MLFQQVSIAILGLAVATEAAIIPEFDGLGQIGLVRRQNRFGGGGNRGGAFGGNNQAKASTTAKAAAATSAAATNNNGNNAGNNNNNAGGNAGGNAGAATGATCLDTSVIQANSDKDGQDVPTAGQAASATDPANFINFCKGQTITNGLQVKAGSCNGIVMGKIPSTANMITGIITSPKPMEDLDPNQTFTVSVQTKGLAAGAFTNAQETYYSAPQDLDGSGKIIGHTHLTIQDLGNSLAPTQPPDPVSFVFFKGVNDNGNGNGLLSATVTGGLPAGNYRVCSMTSSANHQPVLMPVAQRGAQDDCQKFTVGAGNGNAAGGNNNNAGGNNAAAGGNNAATGGNNAAGGGNNAATGGNANTGGGKAAASSAAATSAKAAATKAATNQGGAKGGKGSVASSAPAPAQTSAQASTGAATGTSKNLGGAAPAVTDSGDKARPFKVNGQTFVNEGAAKQRSCDIQNNACFDAVNGGKLKGVTTADCAAQQTACNAA